MDKNVCCVRCGGAIPNARPNQKYCGPCLEQHTKDYQAGYRAAHKQPTGHPLPKGRHAAPKAPPARPQTGAQGLRHVGAAARACGMSYGHYVACTEPPVPQRPAEMTRRECYLAYDLHQDGLDYPTIAQRLDREPSQVIKAVDRLTQDGADLCELCRWRPAPSRACIWPRCFYAIG